MAVTKLSIYDQVKGIAAGGTSAAGDIFVVSDTSGTIIKATGLTYNTGTSTLSTTTFSGNATNATNTAITDDTTTNATMYPTWVTTASGNQVQKVSSTKLTFNPSTGSLSASGTVAADTVAAAYSATIGPAIDRWTILSNSISNTSSSVTGASIALSNSGGIGLTLQGKTIGTVTGTNGLSLVGGSTQGLSISAAGAVTVAGTLNADAATLTTLGGGAGGGAPLIMRGDGTGTGSAMLSGNVMGYLGFRGKYDGSTFSDTSSSKITACATETWNSGAKGGNLIFSTTPNGTTTALDRLTIGEDGIVTAGVSFSGAGTGLTGTASGLTAGTATNAVNVGITNDTTTNATYYPMISTATTGNVATKTSSTKLTFNPSTGVLSATTFSGSGASLTGTGSSFTAGTATNATNTAITDDTTTNATMYPTWVTTASSNQAQKVSSTKLSFNPSTGTLSATTFSGAGTSLTGTAASFTAGTATNATNIAITNDTTTNATMYPVWVTATSGNLPAKASSAGLSFNPSTGQLAATKLLSGGTDCSGRQGTQVCTLVLSNGDNHNVNPTSSHVYIAGPTGAFAITGIAGGYNGQELTFFQNTAQTMTVKYENAGSTATNRIRCKELADVVCGGTYFAWFRVIYDPNYAEWMLVGHS